MNNETGPRAGSEDAALDDSTAGAVTLIYAIGSEIGWQPMREGYFTGPCPKCGVAALAWAERMHEPDDRWRCASCHATGSLFALHALAADHRRAA